jgi:iron(III) transport system permease protein
MTALDSAPAKAPSDMEGAVSPDSSKSRSKWGQRLAIGGVVLVLVYLCVPPLIFLLWQTFSSDSGLTLDGFRRAFSTYGITELSVDTLTFTVASTLISVVCGTFLAWYTERTNLRFKSMIFIVGLIPLIVPGLLYAIAWILLLSPQTGVLAGPVNTLLGHDFVNIYSMFGMSLVQGLDNAPLAFLLMVAAFRSMDPSLEESAHVNGASPWNVFSRITLPLARPGLIAAFLVVGVRAVEGFEIPTLIGTPAGIEVFTSRIWQVVNAYPSDFQQAGAYSVVLLLITGLLVYSQGRYLRGGKRFATVSGKGFRPGRMRIIGSARPVLTGIAVVYMLASFVAPVGILLYASTQPFYAQPSVNALSRFTLEPYVYVLSQSKTSTALVNSLLLAVGAATVVTAICAVAAWVIVRHGARGGWLLDNLTFVPFVFPGIVLGVALLVFYVRVPLPIFGTLWVLLIAYVTRFIPYGMRYAVTAMVKISRELEQAGEVAGARWSQVFRWITLPLIMPGLMAGWIYVAIVSLRELSSSILLYSPGNEVSAIIIFEMWGDGQISELAAFGIIILAISAVLVLVGRRVSKGFDRGVA